jgi:hypothetical protein
VEQRGPAVCNGSNNKEGKGEMTKTPISLQDLRRSLYVKAKAEPTWRFWGLYVHVCKMDTLREAYQIILSVPAIRDRVVQGALIRRHMRRARHQTGLGWKRWSSEWIYEQLVLFNNYQVNRPRPLPKGALAR